MPELPEVETTLRGVTPYIHQQTISKVIVRQPRLRWPVPANISRALINQTIIEVMRRGKYLILKTQEGAILIHLGMSGKLCVLTQASSPKKHDHIDVVFFNNIILRFTDPRRFGAFLWVEGDPYNHALLKSLGVEPLSSQFTSSYLKSRAKNKVMPIKSFLMDSKIVTGVGNIYAAETLFKAGVHPQAQAGTLSLQQWGKVAKAIKHILQQAIKQGGTTLKDFVNSEGKPGYFSTQLKVYGREGLACVQCKEVLQYLRIGQRSTVYCPVCQLL